MPTSFTGRGYWLPVCCSFQKRYPTFSFQCLRKADFMFRDQRLLNLNLQERSSCCPSGCFLQILF